jgi:hypothetical protein
LISPEKKQLLPTLKSNNCETKVSLIKLNKEIEDVCDLTSEQNNAIFFRIPLEGRLTEIPVKKEKQKKFSAIPLTLQKSYAQYWERMTICCGKGDVKELLKFMNQEHCHMMEYYDTESIRNLIHLCDQIYQENKTTESVFFRQKRSASLTTDLLDLGEPEMRPSKIRKDNVGGKVESRHTEGTLKYCQ